MRAKIYLLMFLVVGTSFVEAQVPAPAPRQAGPILLMNGTAHIGNGEVIDRSVIAFENGKITIIANAATIKLDMAAFDTIINIEGQHVYPGLISPNSTLGLTEIGQVRATHDFKEVGTINPHIRSIIAYNTDSKITPTVRSNGVLIAQTTPRGGMISGTSSIVQLDAWNWEDAVIKMDDGIHLNWPKLFQRKGEWWEPKRMEKNKKGNKQLEKLRSFFTNAKAYNRVTYHVEKNLRFEAMKGLFAGEQTLFIHVNYAKEIIQAVNFVRDFEIKKTVLVGAYDCWMLTDLLKENNIAVMLRRVHDLPMRPAEDIDLPFKIPAILQKEGVLYCLENSGDMEAMGTRNLPFYAGTAAAYGLTREEAIMSITSNSAKILSIDDQVGTLEIGKHATLFVSKGDALDIRTNDVTHAFIDGRLISLDNHQKQLYEKFRRKYKEQKK